MMLADGLIGQMMEPVEMPEFKTEEELACAKPWAVAGWHEGCGKPRAVINSLYIEDEALEALHQRLQSRYREIEKNEVRYETFNTEDAEVIIVAYGTVSRVCRSAIDELTEQGLKVGLIRPITLWPFPSAAIAKIVSQPSVKKALTVEISAGQMVEDVRLAAGGSKEVAFLGYPGSRIATVEEIVAKVKALREE